MKEKIGLTDKTVESIARDGYLRSFIDYASEQTDSPKKFLLMSGLMTLAGAVGNRVWVKAWGQRIFSNLWVILVAPSGVYRKNTAIDLGLNLLRQAVKGRITPADFSREAWLDSLQNNPAQVMVSKEFGELLTKLNRDYMAGTKETLTDLFTSTPVYERVTKGGGLVRIEWPCISLIGGSSLIWLQERLKNSDLEGGFLARFLLTTATTKEQWLGIRRYRDDVIEESLIEYLKKVSEIEIGDLSIDEVEGDYNMWLHNYENKMISGQVPPELEGFAARLGSYCLKLSMLFEISSNWESRSISSDSLARASLILEYITEELTTLIDRGLSLDRIGRDIERLKIIVSRNGGISQSEALRVMKCDSQYFQKLIKTLIERQEIYPERIGTKGRTKIVYQAKDAE